MPASKLTRVRSDCFSNSSANTRPGSKGSRSTCANFVFRSVVIAKIRWISSAETSASVIRCRMDIFGCKEREERRSRQNRLLRMTAQYVYENVAAFVDLFIAECHRRKKANDSLLRAVNQQAAIQALLNNASTFAGELQTDH